MAKWVRRTSVCGAPVTSNAMRQYQHAATMVLGTMSICWRIDVGPSEQGQQAVVYGGDDRQDLGGGYPAEYDGAARALLALIPGQRLLQNGDGSIGVVAETLRDVYNVCEDEEFAEQPVAANCSGVLIDEDLLLTARHCFGASADCSKFAYVAGYTWQGTGVVMQSEDIYGCRSVVAEDDLGLDFAIVQLDRPVAGPLSPLRVSAQAPEPNTTVALLGFPSGLPAKIGTGMVLNHTDSDANHVLLALDAFQGSSGGPVVNESGDLSGVLISGAVLDYVQDGDCQRVREVPELGDETARGELALRASSAVSELCASGFPSHRLCGTQASCGDGYCSLDEECVADCREPACRGLDCQSGEAGFADSHVQEDAPDEETAAQAMSGCHAGPAIGSRSAPVTQAAIWLALLSAVLRMRSSRKQSFCVQQITRERNKSC
jgi:hypothetical protein